ncbi:hypothetical protein [Paenibacillus contaminans]|uniref:Uncharacterized protein n=1 Tax=Paenibacillus contaminans TaxID=450362 RepID=A0A329MSX8_9BACL|nr:hypothetical protein [Paenibacillus contaminans]RAV22662.1 hypothetical protein DQG23_00125 [Paenibacillus contaminans]
MELNKENIIYQELNNLLKSELIGYKPTPILISKEQIIAFYELSEKKAKKARFDIDFLKNRIANLQVNLLDHKATTRKIVSWQLRLKEAKRELEWLERCFPMYEYEMKCLEPMYLEYKFRPPINYFGFDIHSLQYGVKQEAASHIMKRLLTHAGLEFESRSNTKQKEQPLSLTLEEQLERNLIKKEYLEIKYEDEEWVVAIECSDWNSYDIWVFNKKDYTKSSFDSAGWELPWEEDGINGRIDCIVEKLNEGQD